MIEPDGYVKIKDRSKDIIISGGENISSLEVEDVLYRHKDVLAAAVVATPDDKWGEVPCAFIELREGAEPTQEELLEYCRTHLARFKVPQTVHLRRAAENLDRQDPEIRAARKSQIRGSDQVGAAAMTLYRAPVRDMLFTLRDRRRPLRGRGAARATRRSPTI